MSSRLLIPNTTQVPNVLMDEVMRTLSTAAVKVLFAICRYTYGFGKQSDSISLKQLQDMTGLSRWSVIRCRNELGNLIRTIPGSAKGQRASVYTLNLDISSGQLVTLCDQSQKVTSHIARHPSAPIQTNSKPIKSIRGKPPNSSSPIVEKTIRRLNELAGTTYRHDTKATVRLIGACLAEGFTEEDLARVLEYKWSEWEDNKEMAKYFRPETLFAPKHFEGYLQAAKLNQGSNRHGTPPKVVQRDEDMLTLEGGSTIKAATYERRYGVRP